MNRKNLFQYLSFDLYFFKESKKCVPALEQSLSLMLEELFVHPSRFKIKIRRNGRSDSSAQSSLKEAES